MLLFTKLLLAHLIGDFMLQPTRWVVHKEVHKMASGYLYLHILVHFGVTMLLLWDLDLWFWAAVIAGSHYFIDLGKMYALHLFKYRSIPFFIDQLLHLVVLYSCAYHANLLEHTLFLISEVDWSLVTAIVFVGGPSSIIMAQLLEGMSDRISLDHKSLPNAGKYIGIIERLFVLGFIVMGRWEAIGLLIAAKSVFRFNDLKEGNSRKLTEYILIGTLMSFGLAMIAGIIYINTN
ncbi:DUF3307 domain-containing protein [Arenibacter lacus]|uniref:DUF3307 domain-containing protein n=1 Tax=Arenibacter lacus TaxID=2608629 RepID=UPI00123D0D68|nr:DUF3307 domain-containing protein [Arenibacter lacus]